jgi:hypothetical protein
MGIPTIIVEACAGVCVGVLYALVMVLVWPISQVMVSHSTFEFPYSVVYPCEGTSNVIMVNEVTFNWRALLHSDFIPHEWSVSAAPVDGTSEETPLGTAKFPLMSVATGRSSFGLTAPIEVVDQDLFSKQFLNPMFVEGKRMKLVLEVQGLRLNELGFFPCPGLHMKNVLVCKAVNATEANQIPKQILADHCSSTKVVETPSEEGNDVVQMTDLVQMASRRLRAHGKYAMQCVPEESSKPSVVV